MPLDFSNLFPQFQGAPQVQTPMTQDVSGGASIGPVPLGIQAGPLGAMQQMQNYSMANQAFAGNMQAQQLDQANAQNTYQNLLKNNPMLDSQRDVAMAQLGVTKNLYKNNLPLMQEAATSDVSKTIAANYAAATASQQAEMTDHFVAASNAAQILNESGYNKDPKLDKFDYTDSKTWSAIQAALKPGNVTGVGDTPSRAEAQRIIAEAQAGINTTKQLQLLKLGDSDFVHKVGTGNAAMGTGELQVSGEYTLAAQKYLADYGFQRSMMMRPQADQILDSVRLKAQHFGYIEGSDLQQVVSTLIPQTIGGNIADQLQKKEEVNRTAEASKNIDEIVADAKKYGIDPGANPNKIDLATQVAAAVRTKTENSLIDQRLASELAGMPVKLSNGQVVPIEEAIKIKNGMGPNTGAGVSPGTGTTVPVARTGQDLGAPTTPVSPAGGGASVRPQQAGGVPEQSVLANDFVPGPNASPQQTADQIIATAYKNPKNAHVPPASMIAALIQQKFLSPKGGPVATTGQ